MSDVSASRKRGDSVSVSSESVARDRPERLIHENKRGEIVGTTFVDTPSAISRSEVQSTAEKACQLTTVFTDTRGEVQRYRGQAGLLRGERLSVSPDNRPAKKLKTSRVSFEHHAAFASTPVTARHNVASENEENYSSAEIAFRGGITAIPGFLDGGCVLTEVIELRAATEDEDAVTWDANDWVLGTKIEDTNSSLTKKPLQFEKAPSTFELQVGHKIAISVYRTFDITHEDACAPAATAMEEIYGSKNRACIYTGEVTGISENGETFEHDINTFKGCSGAVIFLLDIEQSESVDSTCFGKAVGIHVGGLTGNECNVGFKLR